MIRGLYTAAKAMATETKRVDVLANNIANADTNGYKKDLVVTGPFSEVLISRLNDDGIPEGLKPFNGISAESGTDGIKIEAKGAYLVIDTPRGKSFSSGAQLQVSPEGYLITMSGNFILGQRGRIRVGSYEELSIDDRGNVFAGDRLIDSLKLFTGPNVIGTLNGGSRIDKIVTPFIQGNFKETDCPTDLAIKGEGFFVVQVDGEERYTRDGSFIIDSQGYLTTKEGHRVMGERGELRIGDDGINIGNDGEVYAGEYFVDRLRLVTFEDPMDVVKTGDNLYRANDITRRREGIQGEVLQGFLESSNVNTVKEMVNMITAFRTYEANQKIVSAYDEILGKAVNEVGRV